MVPVVCEKHELLGGYLCEIGNINCILYLYTWCFVQERIKYLIHVPKLFPQNNPNNFPKINCSKKVIYDFFFLNNIFSEK